MWIKCMTNYYILSIYIVPLVSVDGQASPRLFIAPEIRHEKISNKPSFLAPGYEDSGYPHDGRADKDTYRHDGRAYSLSRIWVSKTYALIAY